MSFYTSLTGLNSATAQLAVTSNNIANVGTAGFKRSRADFGDIFSTSPLQKSSSTIGQGVSLKQVSQEFSQGNISTSGNSLDLAITGDGFFPLKSPDGLQDIYTRNGSFTLNDQNNVVNSTGQRLLAASVDSSGKADLTNLSPLVIPPKTSGQAVETTSIQLGLNLPASSPVIPSTTSFDRTNPSTYNKSTALTVYDSGGNGYLATVYYVKTQNASQASPFSKWQTYFFVGDTQVKPALQQATNTLGSALYVNKYGEVLPKSDPRVVPSTGTTEMYTLDQLTDERVSTPATAVGSALAQVSTVSPINGTFAEGDTVSLDIGGIKFTYEVAAGETSADVIDGLAALVNAAAPAGSALAEAEVADDGSIVLTARTAGASGAFNASVSATVAANDFSGGTVSATIAAANPPGGLVEFSLQVDGMSEPVPIEYELTEEDTDPEVLARNLEVAINNTLGVLTTVADRRYGIQVRFDPKEVSFSIASGTTGDTSSIAVTDPAGAALDLGFTATQPLLSVAASTSTALRGQPSEPAILLSDPLTNTTKEVAVNTGNRDFFVSVDGIGGQIQLPTGPTTMQGVAGLLETAINSLVDPETGRRVTGVKVIFDEATRRLKFTTGTTGDGSSLQVTGSPDWGLADVDMAFGKTSEWIKLTQYTENGAPQFVKNGVQTEDASNLSSKTEWWPIYLDRGELSFDLTGKPVSPLKPMAFETAFLDGGKGALTMSIDFTQSTQYSSPFAVLSQSQDGAPEGDLLGLEIGVDGLVSATYSNGSQVSLGKIVLANFSSPSGLRQIGDASYLASATSGSAKVGEAGSAGYGSIRAGATERANVDLTQELVDLITAQRNFQANAKAIETSSTMTQAIINLRS